MPAVSKKQFRLMGAASRGKVKGVDPAVAREFLEKSRGTYDRLPNKKRKSKR